MIRGGIDIGGTFTDIVYIDDETGEISSYKIPTTAANPAIGVLNGIAESKVNLNQVWLLVHGTTIVINAIISHMGAKTALITTEGCRDLLEIGRGNRLESFNVFYKKPEPLIPRKWRIAVSERLDWRGNTIVKLNFQEVEKALDYFLKEAVESIAVCFLHAYADPKHELEVKRLIESKYKNMNVTLSSEVLSEIREFERLSTTVVSAYTKPAAKKYIEELEVSLSKRGYRSSLYLMQSNGGIIDSEMAKTSPVQIVESGPVGGIVACKYYAALMGYKNLVVFDMGGTTSKAGLVINGNISITRDYSPGGYPVRVSVADMVELGIGGGSIAWIDDAGFLKVGPVSAGADPGPVSYGLGGVEPTVTDANLVLGRIRGLLGGTTELYKEKACSSIIGKIANPLSIDLITAANAIIEIAVSMLIDELRAVSTLKGIDLRDFVMFAFGGAGPMHCALMTRETGISSIIIPRAAGAFSALGFLCSDLKHDFVKTQVMKLKELDSAVVEEIYDRLALQGVETLQREKVGADDISIQKSLDMRYVGQAYEINVPFEFETVSSKVLDKLENVFTEFYEDIYGHSNSEEAIEIVNFRLAATGKLRKPPLNEIISFNRKLNPKGMGQVYFKETGWINCPFYDRGELAPETEVRGPAVIEEYTSTTLIPPDFESHIDKRLNIVIRKG